MMFFFNGYSATTILGFLALVLALILLNELTRRSKAMSLLFYGVVPVILLS